MPTPNFIEEKIDQFRKRFYEEFTINRSILSYISVSGFLRQALEEAIAEERKKLSTLKSEVEGMKKSVIDLFPDADVRCADELLALQVLQKQKYNEALQQVINLIEKYEK